MAYMLREDEDFKIIGVFPKNDENGVQKKEKDTSENLWSLQALHTPRNGGRAALAMITFATNQDITALPPMAYKPVDVEVDHYSVGTSNGLWFKCAGIAEVSAAATSRKDA